MVKRISTTLLVLLSSTGCSLLIDNSPFLGSDAGVQPDAGGGGDGGRDAGRDAGPNAPTTPEVHIEPAEPRTLDDLSVVIDVESTDPLAAGAITYEHRWLRDAEDTGETGTTIASARTAKGQTWTVEVTPVTADDRRGPPATASVTILNTPPTIRTVGLSSYRPVEGDVLEALTGTVVDVDGDPTSVAYVWSVDGAPVSGSANQLSLDPVIAPAGSLVRIEALPNDGEADGVRVTAGPARVVTNVTRWTQLMPDLASVQFAFLDEDNERVILLVESGASSTQVWEHDLITNRFVQLHPMGAPVSSFTTVTLPGRLMYFAEEPQVTPTQLDVRSRGAEQWTPIEIDSATRPSGRVVGGVYDPELDRIIYALIRDSTGDAEIHSLDLSRDPVVDTAHAVGLSIPIEGAGWGLVQETRTIYVFGGTAGGDAPATDLIHRIDANDPSAIVASSVHMPASMISPVVHSDALSGRVIFGFGLDTMLAPVPGLWTFDPAGAVVEPVDLSEGPTTAVIPQIGIGPDGELLLISRDDAILGPGRYRIMSLDRSEWTTHGEFRVGTDSPPALRGAIASISANTLTVYGGADSAGDVHDGVWQSPLPARTTLARLQRVTPDVTLGDPGARYDVALDAALEALLVFSGRGDSDVLLGGTAYRLDETRWIPLALSTSSPAAPEPRAGAVLLETCGVGSGIAVFGGRTSTGVTSETWVLDCASGDSNCAWSAFSATGDTPTPREHSAAGGRYGNIVFGGRAADGTALGDVYDFGACFGTWARLTPASPPPPRFGHGFAGPVLFGGRNSAIYLGDAYVVDGLGTSYAPVVEPADHVAAPRPRAFPAIAWDPLRERAFVFGGYGGRSTGFFARELVFSDLWELRVR